MTSAPKSDRITAALGPAMKLAKSTTFSPEKILSFMVCLVRLSKGRATSGPFGSLTFEVRLAFFAERGHALFPVLGTETLGEERRLDVQPFCEAHVETPVRGFDRQFDRRRGIRIDLVQDGFPPLNEVILGNDFVDQADPVGLLCVDHVGAENQLQRASLADQPRQALRSSVAWDDADRHLRLAELGRFDSQPDRGGHRQLAAPAECEAVNGRDDRLAKVFDDLCEALPVSRLVLCLSR